MPSFQAPVVVSFPASIASWLIFLLFSQTSSLDFLTSSQDLVDSVFLAAEVLYSVSALITVSTVAFAWLTCLVLNGASTTAIGESWLISSALQAATNSTLHRHNDDVTFLVSFIFGSLVKFFIKCTISMIL